MLLKKTNEHKYYDAISDAPFKEHYENYKSSFRQRSHLTASDLSKYYWKLVDNGAVPTIKCSIANSCNICLSGKAFIIISRVALS